MINFILLILLSFNVQAQILPGMPSIDELKGYLNDRSEAPMKTKKYSFINSSINKKNAQFLLYCYTANGIEIPRYSGVGLVTWQGRFLVTDVETVDGRFIRIPSSNCFIESVPK